MVGLISYIGQWSERRRAVERHFKSAPMEDQPAAAIRPAPFPSRANPEWSHRARRSGFVTILVPGGATGTLSGDFSAVRYSAYTTNMVKDLLKSAGAKKKRIAIPFINVGFASAKSTLDADIP
ncbi:MAG TPA: hypothetical protein VGR71_01005 [Nitrospira sp.]|nr:hypothetical protein [Nitrospira sp.]